MSRGALRIYLGAAPGVGKTFAMLDEAARRRARGADVVIGIVETHGRPRTEERLEGLEVLANRLVEHRGTELPELDVDALLARRPDVALIDELAHTNAPGSRHEKRWADIDEVLDAGIDVISTVNVQHLESLNDVVERITGIRQSETVPDAWVRRAEQVELVDMTPEALRRRMAHGNVYPAERIDAALANYFRPGNLAALRELALLWLADRVEDDLQDYLRDHSIDSTWETRERVLVALTGAPGNDAVIRRAARIAGRIGGELLGVHVVSSDGLRSTGGAELETHRRVLTELGGTYREVPGNDVAEALVAVARSERATQLVIGASRRSWFEELRGGSVVNRLLRLARGDLDVHVISSEAPDVGRLLAAGPVRPLRAVPRRRALIAWGMLLLGLPLLLLTLDALHDELGLATDLLAAMLLVVAIAAVGGLLPGLVAAVLAVTAINWFLVPPTRTFEVGDPENVLALGVFVAVAATVATLVDRVARRSAEAARATAEAAALARASASLAALPDPLPELLEQLRVTFDLDGVSVLRRDGSDGWVVEARAGEAAPDLPSQGVALDLAADGRTVVVFRPEPLRGEASVLEAITDSLTVALDARRLRADAADAAVLAEADALRTGILQAVSHDLRTPLAGIKASVTSLLAPDVSFGPRTPRGSCRRSTRRPTDSTASSATCWTWVGSRSGR